MWTIVDNRGMRYMGDHLDHTWFEAPGVFTICEPKRYHSSEEAYKMLDILRSRGYDGLSVQHEEQH